ncbi:MAG: DUF2817 domain-containing protein [Isosphaeraceae bacterium]
MSPHEAFSPDYFRARDRFRKEASQLGWQLEAHPIGGQGPGGEELTIDVACSPWGDPARVLVVSSGVHGVEGFFGSAVQSALLEEWSNSSPPPARCVFLHGLNPYGFAWLRRFDEDNVDPNRNFLLPGESFEGASDAYARLDGFLNPRRPPSRVDLFLPRALLLIARHGMPALRQAVAAGQYAFPRGLFFGGKAPTPMNRLLSENLGRWLRGSERVVHLDFHTGLGPWASWKLLIDYRLEAWQRTWLETWFGAGSFETGDNSLVAYDARGGFGRWCVARRFAPEYLFACAEFGTYGPVSVLAGLRAENRAHHWGAPGSASMLRAGERLKELFCPSSASWRSLVVEQGLDLVRRGMQGLFDQVPRP